MSSITTLKNEEMLQTYYHNMTVEDVGSSKIAMYIEVMTEKLREMGFVYRIRVPPKRMGIHPSNRDFYGFASDEVLDLGEGITDIGVSFQAARGAAAFEESPCHQCCKHTRALCNPIESLATFQERTKKQ